LTNHTDKVEKIRSRGRPAEKPNKDIPKDFLLRSNLIFKEFIN
jgi:hypothetical protein